MQMELALVDHVKYAPLINKTLDYMFRLEIDNGRSPKGRGKVFKYSRDVKPLWEKLAYQDAASFASHFVTALEEAASSHHKLGNRETSIKWWIQVTVVCEQLAKLDTCTYIPWLADAVQILARHSPKDGNPFAKRAKRDGVDDSRSRLWFAWSTLARQDASYIPCLRELLTSHIRKKTVALSQFFDSPCFDIASTVKDQLEAVDIWRGLAKRDPITHSPNLAGALNEVASTYWALGHFEKSIGHRRESLGVWQALVEQDSSSVTTATLVGLAESLHDVVAYLARLQLSTEAIDCSREADGVWRELTKRNASENAFHLVKSLHETGALLFELGHHDQALTQYSEAVEVSRSHMEDGNFPDPFLYPRSLDMMSWCLISLNRHADAKPLIHECVDLLRSFQRHTVLRPRHIPPPSRLPIELINEQLSMCLNTQSVIFTEIGEFKFACVASEESVKRLRPLVRFWHDQYFHELAPALHNLSLPLCSLGQHDQALRAIEEAVDIYRTLTLDGPSRYDQNFAGTLRRYAYILSQSGESIRAMKANEDASKIEGVLMSRTEATRSSPKIQVRIIMYHSKSSTNLMLYSTGVYNRQSTNL